MNKIIDSLFYLTFISILIISMYLYFLAYIRLIR
uniref:Uncharacterized protein n=1 Tax=Myoviridae sp. ctJ2i1 TaxID=2825079 RepID=A0A8S5V2C0_9CAUD|nr:MAG TPA: hypothetical protein [Myoviridae sp. ctJ2i1]